MMWWDVTVSCQLNVFSFMFKIRVSRKHWYQGHEISYLLRDIQDCSRDASRNRSFASGCTQALLLYGAQSKSYGVVMCMRAVKVTPRDWWGRVSALLFAFLTCKTFPHLQKFNLWKCGRILAYGVDETVFDFVFRIFNARQMLPLGVVSCLCSLQPSF